MGKVNSIQLMTNFFTRARFRALVLLGILVGVGIVRLVIVRTVIAEPTRGILVDSEQYLELATNLLGDGDYEGLTDPTLDLFRTPGYPAFLALLLGLQGGSLRTVVIIQFFLVLITAFLLYEVGRSLKLEKVGVAAAFLLLLSPNVLFWSVIIMTETLFLIGLTLAFLWMVKAMDGRFPYWGVGILLGILAFIRPIAFVIILLWAAWVFLYSFKKSGWKSSIKNAAIFLIAAMFIVLPWFFRNKSQHGKFTLSNVSGITISSFHLALTLVDAEGISWEDAKLEVGQMGNNVSAAAEIMLNHPISFVKIQLRGLARTILGSESSTWLWLISEDRVVMGGTGLLDTLLSLDFSLIRDSYKRLVAEGNLPFVFLFIWGLVYTFILVSLSIFGLFLGLQRGNPLHRAALILGLITVAYLVISPGAAGEARFRVPVEPILALMSGFALFGRSKTNHDISAQTEGLV